MNLPFSIIVPTVYGTMIVNRNDINQTNSLFKTGCAPDHEEIVLLSTVLSALGTNLTFIDVGANFGAYSLGLARSVGPQGKIHAFEPQRVLFNMLAGSVALNSLLNVYCHNLAVGDHEGKVELPQFDYTKPLNFGSIEFTDEQREPLTQPRAHHQESVEYVPLTTLDKFAFARVDLLKVDVEGMEMQVFAGAKETIARCRPVIHTEHIKSDRQALRSYISDLGYKVYESPMNFLCIPLEYQDRIKIVDHKLEIKSRE